MFAEIIAITLQRFPENIIEKFQFTLVQFRGIETGNWSRKKIKAFQLPGEVRDHHPGESKDETDHGDSDEEHPPDPENQEVLLVEDVVVEDAKVVAPVNSSSSGTNVDVAWDLIIGYEIIIKLALKNYYY